MDKIEAVIFDVGGVLHQNNSVVTDDLTKELGLDQATLKKIWATQMPLLGSGRIDEAEFWRQVHAEYGIREVQVGENLLGRAFAEALEPNMPVYDFVKELGAHGIKLAVLSNTIEPHAATNRQAGVYDGFDHVLLSHEIGLRKPDRETYQYALDVLGSAPQNTAFVDDDPANVAAAEALGIHGVIFTEPEATVAELRSLVFGEG